MNIYFEEFEQPEDDRTCVNCKYLKGMAYCNQVQCQMKSGWEPKDEEVSDPVSV